MIALNLQGFIELKNKFNPTKFKKHKIEKIVFRVGNFFETKAKSNINKSVYRSAQSKYYTRSGKAQQSIVFNPMGLQGRVHMGVNYGRYLEEGTGIYHTPDKRKPWITSFGGLLPTPILMKGMKARPFWTPAYKTTKNQIPKIAKEILSE